LGGDDEIHTAGLDNLPGHGGSGGTGSTTLHWSQNATLNWMIVVCLGTVFLNRRDVIHKICLIWKPVRSSGGIVGNEGAVQGVLRRVIRKGVSSARLSPPPTRSSTPGTDTSVNLLGIFPLIRHENGFAIRCCFASCCLVLNALYKSRWLSEPL
jgi:hypothetical protein